MRANLKREFSLLNVIIIPFFCIFCLYVRPAVAGPMSELIKKVEVDGEVEIGLEHQEWSSSKQTGNKVYSEETHRIGKLEADFRIKPVKKLYFTFDLSYDIENPAVEVDKLYGAVKLHEEHQLRLGYMKKQFGIEGTQKATERLFSKRSVLYEYVKSFHVMGHDLLFYYRKKLPKEHTFAGSKFWIGLGGDASKRYFGIARTDFMVPNLHLSTSFMYVNTQDSFEKLQYFLVNGGVNSDFPGKYQLEFEITSGLDPSATAMEKELETQKKVYFTGLRLENSLRFKTGGKVLSSIIPMGELTYIWKDMGNGRGEAQIRPGLMATFGTKEVLRFLINGDFRFANQGPDFEEYIQNYESFLVEFQIVW